MAGQVVGHAGLGVVTARVGSTGDDGPSAGAHLSHVGSHAHLAHAQAGHVVGDGSEWSSVTGAFGHLVHAGPAMHAAHAVAALLTAVLVPLVVDGLRRAARRFVVLLLAVVRPRTPYPAPPAAPLVVVPASRPLVRSHPLRGPPRHS